MSLEQYLVPCGGHANDICFSCRRACGKCPWSATDPVTDEIRYEPVPGWTAKPAKLFCGYHYKDGHKLFTDTWHITACPLYSPDRPEPPLHKMPAPPPKNPNPYHTGPVEKVDASGEVVAVYPSVIAAARANRVNVKTVRYRCYGEIKSPLAPDGCNFRFKTGGGGRR